MLDATDTDGDGLDDSLERTLGTCASRQDTVNGVDCSQIADVRDTDGDGLQDGWEVLGFQRPGMARLPLPVWGATPRHKDIFLEVDFRRDTKADNDQQKTEKMSPSVAKAIAAAFADQYTSDPALGARHAASISNPDGQPGVRLHMDIGQPPLVPEDATIYGDWGGFNAVDAIPSPSNPANYIPQSPSAWQDLMDPSRHGAFHYALGYPRGGGQCGMGIACAFSIRTPLTPAHEFGHTLGLMHEGSSSPGQGLPEPNCKPNYPSMMNYAFKDGNFPAISGGDVAGKLNNHRLIESGAFPPGDPIFDRLSNEFKLKIDRTVGNVDWNRDGRFSPEGTTVRANATMAPDYSCESTRYHEAETGLSSVRSPAIVRFKDRLWVFAVRPDGKLASTQTLQPYVCDTRDRCPAPVFQEPALEAFTGLAGVDSVVTNVAGRPVVLIVGIRSDGRLSEAWFEERNGVRIWSGPHDIPSSPAAGEPSLAVSEDGTKVALAYRTQNGRVVMRWRQPNGYQPEMPVSSAGQPITMSDDASPAIAFARLPLPTDLTAAGPEKLLGAFIKGKVKLFVFRSSAGSWDSLPILVDQMPPSTTFSNRLRTAIGRPSMAWIAERPANALPDAGNSTEPFSVDRLYVAYVEKGEDQGENPVRWSISYVGGSGSLQIGLDGYFDNVWHYANGIDFLPGREAKLISAETLRFSYGSPSWEKVFVRPHADGIVDREYGDSDDWTILKFGVCQTLAGAQPQDMRVNCP